MPFPFPFRAVPLSGMAALATGMSALCSSTPCAAQSAAAPGQFALKVSGYGNASSAATASQPDTSGGGLGETEVELTPQYRTTSGTVIALRGVANVQGVASAPNRGYRASVPEVSLFAIGSFGRIEIGARAGFPQSLVGFTPSEIAFTTPGFGPESGARLDPDGGLPTSFLPGGLASRINALTYLGYAARFYNDASPKVIYLTPRSRGGFYAAASYTPSTVRPSGFTLADGGRRRAGDLDPALLPHRAHDVVQAALVWNHRTEALDLSLGASYSHASIDAFIPGGPRHASNSLSGGVNATIRDTWSLGISATYDGLSRDNLSRDNLSRDNLPRDGLTRSPDRVPAPRSATRPFGVVASADYVGGPWTVGGYYQHATADSQTLIPTQDTVDIGEFGLSYLIDRNHDLLGQGFHTDVKVFAGVYLYRFTSGDADANRVHQAGQVFLAGTRFSFY